jgi:hypothetical protein
MNALGRLCNRGVRISATGAGERCERRLLPEGVGSGAEKNGIGVGGRFAQNAGR